MKLLPTLAFINAATAANVKCMNNNGDGDIVEMSVTVAKAEVQRDLQDDGFAYDDTTKTYAKTWAVGEFNESDKSVEDNYLVLTKSVATECKKVNVDDVDVCVKTGHNLTFKCKYELGTKTVKKDFNVSGHDTNVSEVGYGTLNYELKVMTSNVKIGSNVDVNIIPKNPNLVFAAIQECSVKHNGQSVSIVNWHEGKKEARPVCQLGAGIFMGSGVGPLSFYWQSFKWTTAVAKDDDVENQEIECTISLSKDSPQYSQPMCLGPDYDFDCGNGGFKLFNIGGSETCLALFPKEKIETSFGTCFNQQPTSKIPYPVNWSEMAGLETAITSLGVAKGDHIALSARDVQTEGKWIDSDGNDISLFWWPPGCEGGPLCYPSNQDGEDYMVLYNSDTQMYTDDVVRTTKTNVVCQRPTL